MTAKGKSTQLGPRLQGRHSGWPLRKAAVALGRVQVANMEKPFLMGMDLCSSTIPTRENVLAPRLWESESSQGKGW